jgi:hypothetical protein
MLMYTRSWPISRLEERTFQYLEFNPAFQRDAVWPRKYKQKLIQNLLGGMIIPVIYLHRINRRIRNIHGDRAPGNWEVVDGQQRLRAIHEYLTDGFALPDDSWAVYDEAVQAFEETERPTIPKPDPETGLIDVSGMRFSKLPASVKAAFRAHELVVFVAEQATESEVENLFLSLQTSVPLTAHEKRHALHQVVSLRNYLDELVSHPLFSRNVRSLNQTRQGHKNLALQALVLCLQGLGSLNIKVIDRFYKAHAQFDPETEDAKRFQAAVEFCHRALTHVDNPRMTRADLRIFIKVAYDLLTEQPELNLSEEGLIQIDLNAAEAYGESIVAFLNRLDTDTLSKHPDRQLLAVLESRKGSADAPLAVTTYYNAFKPLATAALTEAVGGDDGPPVVFDTSDDFGVLG